MDFSKHNMPEGQAGLSPLVLLLSENRLLLGIWKFLDLEVYIFLDIL